MANVGMAVLQGRTDGTFGQFGRKDMSRGIAKGPIIRIEIGACEYVAGLAAFGQFADAGARAGSDTAHLVVLIYIRSNQNRFVIHHFDDHNLVMMTVIGSHSREPPRLRFRVPLVNVILEVRDLSSE